MLYCILLIWIFQASNILWPLVEQMSVIHTIYNTLCYYIYDSFYTHKGVYTNESNQAPCLIDAVLYAVFHRLQQSSLFIPSGNGDPHTGK
jgi:hypothetical protein